MAILAAIGCFVFPGLAERSYNRWYTKIDDNIPNMLGDVAGGVRSGFNITRSMELAADSDYGPLTEQLKIDKIQLSWGRTFEQVMQDQVKRVDSQLAKRTFTSLAQASKSGGNIQDVLDAIQRHTTELHQIDKETKNALRPYISTTYVAVGIFLGISVVLIDSFFTQIFASQSKVAAAGGQTSSPGWGAEPPGAEAGLPPDGPDGVRLRRPGGGEARRGVLRGRVQARDNTGGPEHRGLHDIRELR